MDSSSLDTSPMVDGGLDSTLNFNDFANTPLFPADGSDFFHQSVAADSNTSFTSAAAGSSYSASPMVHQKSSPGRPSTASSALGRKHSDAAGVKPTKARKPLPDIIIDKTDDKETAKRKKNTAAARKSRMRKQETHETLLAEIDRLRAAVVQLGGDPDQDYSL